MSEVVYIDGDDWVIPDWAQHGDNRTSACRSCGDRILWVVSRRTAKRAPLNPDGTSHFATCPQADSWRKR